MRCWPNWAFALLIVTLGSLSMLSACGQKGELYHPDNATPHKTEKNQH